MPSDTIVKVPSMVYSVLREHVGSPHPHASHSDGRAPNTEQRLTPEMQKQCPVMLYIYVFKSLPKLFNIFKDSTLYILLL